jgi:eukaryotic-like serine/threonine-protein kinase
VSASQVTHIYGEILAAGAVAGSYVLDRLAYQGGFASVYRAHHARSREPVAVKVLRRSLADSLRITLRFRQEAETMRRLEHPNIARIFEVGDLYDGRPYIAMEWLDGPNLAQEMQTRGAFSPHEALAVMTELGSAVAAAHRLGIVHRDIKPANVIALPQGEWFKPVLVDFGIAKLTRPGDIPAVITMHSIVGTPQSMAPEQILGRAVDARTDIYALGLLLYEMVTGRAAFAGDTAVEIEEMHLHAVPPSPSSIAPVSPAFDRVVARALQKRKEDRYPTVEELVSELGAAVAADARNAPGRESGVERCQGIGVHVEVRRRDRSTGQSMAPAPGDSDVFEIIDEVLDRVDRAASKAGLVTAVESSNAVVAARALPRAPREEMRVRLDILDRALLLAAEVAEVAEPAGLEVFIAVHVASVDVLGGQSGTDRDLVIDGDLLRLATWPGFRDQGNAGRWPAAAVAVTSAAMTGLEDEFQRTPMNDRLDCWLVRVAR